MDASFRRSLAFSAAFHAALIALTSLHLIIKPKYVVVPVDLLYFAPPAPPPGPPAKKEEEVVIPRAPAPAKKTPKPRKEERKEPAAPSSPPAPLQPSASITPDTAKFPYLYYLRRVREAISSNWGWSGRETGGLKSVVYFKIRRDGTITEPEFKEQSSNAVFDAVALRAVKISAPFAPLPTGYEDDTLGIYFEFSYKE
ncbi:MAG: energy transducer TonB [Endomicrobiia bacterium]|nr:energy transducer TonB [Endomicrobiia bacterium]